MFNIFDKFTSGKAQLRLPLGGTIQEKNKERESPRFEHLISAVGQIDCAESSVAVELNPAVFLYEGSFLHSPQFEIVDRKLHPFVSDFPTDSAGCLPSLLRDRTQAKTKMDEYSFYCHCL